MKQRAWPRLKPLPRVATPAYEFSAADGWEERRGWSRRGASRPRRELSRISFLVVAMLVLLLSIRLAGHLFVRSLGGIAPVASLVAPRLD